MPAIEALLRDAIGLDAASIGSSTVERAVRLRQASVGIEDVEAYMQLALSSESEMQELVETVVVPETWFFRDREAFAALTGVVLQDWLRSAPIAQLRILSLPCSTGEEPYSIAMALLDAGLPPERFSIDAIDISSRALRIARCGLYGTNSFRGDGLGFRDRHFAPEGNENWRLSRAVMERVQFRQANLFNATLAPPYDAVFCRNLLIYFDRPTQDRAITLMHQLLTNKGMLFVGPSETSILGSHDFTSARWPLAFAFRRGKPAEPPKPAAAAKPRRPAPVRPAAAPAPRPAPANITPKAPPAPTRQEDFDAAVQLADQSRFPEATRACESYLRRHGPDADIYNLMGVVKDASGDTSAAEAAFRKALYLQPRHTEALAHLALLLDRQGDHAGALLLRQRNARAQRGHV